MPRSEPEGDTAGATAAEATADAADRRLRAVQDAVVRRWGELAPLWGASRATAEVYALLHVTGRPQSADEVVRRLHLSRGTAGDRLRALCGAGLVRRSHVPGDRRDRFEVAGRIWKMAGRAAAARQRRALIPLLGTVRQCRAMLDGAAEEPSAAAGVAVAQVRLLAVEDLLTAVNGALATLAAGDGRDGRSADQRDPAGRGQRHTLPCPARGGAARAVAANPHQAAPRASGDPADPLA